MKNIAEWIIEEKNKNNPYALDDFTDMTAKAVKSSLLSPDAATVSPRSTESRSIPHSVKRFISGSAVML